MLHGSSSYVEISDKKCKLFKGSPVLSRSFFPEPFLDPPDNQGHGPPGNDPGWNIENS
jgi:hypothetical protein